MINLIGTVSGVFRDSRTGEITKELDEAQNHIQNWYLESLNTVQPSLPNLSQNLFVSSYNPNRQLRNIPGHLEAASDARYGDDIAGIDPFEFFPYDSPGVHLIKATQRFSPPASDYTINSVGLYSSSSGYPANVSNFVWLENPCIQTTTETLDLFYRIQLLFDPNYASNSQDSNHLLPFEVEQIARAMANLSHTGPINVYNRSTYAFYSMNQNKVNSRQINDYCSGTSDNYNAEEIQVGMSNYSRSVDLEFYKTSGTASNTLTNSIGTMFTHLGGIKHQLCYKIADNNTDPVQNIFAHSNTSTTPFYESLTAAEGLGTIAVDGSAWTDPDYAKLFKVDIVTDGVLGTSEYKFSVCPAGSFVGNEFRFRPTLLHWTTAGNTDRNNGFTYHYTEDVQYSSYPVKQSDDYVIFCKDDVLSRTNIHTGENTVVDNTTLFGAEVSPEFLATAIAQVEPNGSNGVYVACRNTGLYRLTETFDDVTVFSSSTPGLSGTTGCHGVHVAKDGRIWAYFNHSTQHGLYYSDDNGANWTLSNFSTVDGNFTIDRVLYVYCDPSNSDQVAVFYLTSGDLTTINNYVSCKWFDNSTDTTSDGPSQASRRDAIKAGFWHYTAIGQSIGHQDMITCSPDDSVWASAYSNNGNSPPAILTFGSNTINEGSSSLGINTSTKIVNWVKNASGNDALLYISSSGQGGSDTANYYYSILLDTDLTTYESVRFSNAIGQNDALLHLGKGVWLAYANWPFGNRACWALGLTCPYQKTEAEIPSHYNMVCPTFGWDGANWVAGAANGKPTHAAAEELAEGITVSFDDSSGSNPFLSSDHYHFVVVDGILFDGFTTAEFSWDLYTKPSYKSTAVESATLPATTKVPNVLVETTPTSDTDFVDMASTTWDGTNLDATGTASDNVYNAGARSAAAVIDSSVSSFQPNAVIVPDTDIKNAQGYVEAYFTSTNNSSTSRCQYYFGISPADRLGQPLDPSTIAHAIHIDTLAFNPSNGIQARIRVVENGIERTYVDNVEVRSSSNSTVWLRVVLLNNGSVAYLYSIGPNNWFTLYQSPAGSVTLEDMYLDVAYVPDSNYGAMALKYYSLDTSAEDYYLYLGNGTNTGVHDEHFLKIDPDSVTVTIDGVEAAKIARDDQDTVLSSNSYSVFPNAGVIRYSASDVGLSVTAEYITLTDE